MLRGRSLTLRLAATIATLVATAVGSVTLMAVQREQKTFRAELLEQSLLLLDTVEVTVQDPLYQLDADFITDYLKKLGQHQELIVAGKVYDAAGRPIADASSTEDIFTLEADAFGQQLLASNIEVFDWQDDRLIAGRAVLLGNQSIGAISVGLSTVPLKQKIASLHYRGVGIAAIAALISAGLSLLISRSIVKPIHTLVNATRAVAKGNFEQPIQINTGDELAQLAHAFNDMSEQLQNTMVLLEQQNKDLENRVEERTADLSQALQELQETHSQLVQSEKMSSLGQLVAGVAHEINNPINFIHGNIQHIGAYTQDLLRLTDSYQRHYPNPPEEIEVELEDIDLPFLKTDLAKVLQSMRMGTERIREIVLSLRSFSRLDESDYKAADIHEGIDSTLMILQHRLKATPERPAIQVLKQYGSIPVIECYPGQLNQVVMNLLANAIDALEENNRDRAYKEIEQNPNIITITTQLEHPSRVSIMIADNGPGIPESAQAKLFNPFFTTKPVGQGTGLGLSISYRIVTESHGGQLSCHSTLGEGTTFVIDISTHQNASQPTPTAV